MSKTSFTDIRLDCLNACATQPNVHAALRAQHIAITGGTGFLGTWIAEVIAALNDEYGLGITLTLHARHMNDWAQRYPHLAQRAEFHLRTQDIRSPFEFSRGTNFVIHAAGIPNNRVHASDPLRVQQTTVLGLNNTLEAASQLDGLVRFLNVSSCLVNGTPNHPGALKETEFFPMPCDQLHYVYAEAKRAAENLAAIYRSQFRLPVSTVRPFTFAGPYQELDRPWALNNFFRDVLTGSHIRIHGDGTARRSYLYGSDAAWWTLVALLKGTDGATYNVGSARAITLSDLADLVCTYAASKPHIAFNTAPTKHRSQDDLFPDLSHTQSSLGVVQTCSLEKIVEKTWRWFSNVN